MTLTMPSLLASRAEARDNSRDIAGPSGIQHFGTAAPKC